MSSFHHKLRKARSGILIVSGTDSVTIPLDFRAKIVEANLVCSVPTPSCAPAPQNSATAEIIRNGIRISWVVEGECEIHWKAEK